MKNKNSKNSIKTLTQITLLLIALLTFTFATKVDASDINNQNVVYLINQERIYHGLQPLKVDTALTVAAQKKADDMLYRHYFEHYAYGLSPWDFMKGADYNYLYAGENLAMDFQTSEGMVNAWMNSSAHRGNILNPDYEDMGLGIVKGAYVENGQTHETTIVTNMFGRKEPQILKVFNKIVSQIAELLKF